MIKRTEKILGSGMTRRRHVRTTYELPEDLPALIRDSKAEPTYEEWLKGLMEFCRRRLRANGFPDTIFVRNGSTRKKPINEYVSGQPGQDVDTDAGFTARILWHADHALQPSTQKEMWRFANHIHQVGSLVAKAALKFSKWEKLALKGPRSQLAQRHC